jgi:predicted dienelactone hydrolase
MFILVALPFRVDFRIAMKRSGSSSLKKRPDPAGRFRRQGPFPVSILREIWFDEPRLRKVPVKIHFPSTGEGLFPVVFFSHGLGGSREGYAYLGRHWASHGIVKTGL